jgi:hypothetical protein
MNRRGNGYKYLFFPSLTTCHGPQAPAFSISIPQKSSQIHSCSHSRYPSPQIPPTNPHAVSLQTKAQSTAMSPKLTPLLLTLTLTLSLLTTPIAASCTGDAQPNCCLIGESSGRDFDCMFSYPQARFIVSTTPTLRFPFLYIYPPFLQYFHLSSIILPPPRYEAG